MAKLDFILQAITPSNHASAIRRLLELPNPTRILISVAYVRKPGVDSIEAAVESVAKRATFYIGIRNDLTSIQAVKALLALKVKLYAVDTASSSIFHPKLYFATNMKEAHAIIGSANLTWGGLYNNVEASTFVKLDLTNTADKEFADEVVYALDAMAAKHPEHVFLITDAKHANSLFESGRLVDEDVVPAPSTARRVKKGERDTLPPMKLIQKFRTRIKSAVAKPVAVPVLSGATAPPQVGKYLVWESKPLRERDLSIPHAEGTHPTGSMGLKKGALQGIDQRHYFREDVFAGLEWIPDDPPKKREHSSAKFELIIKGLNYGVFELKLSHNTDTKSASYQQSNFMTHLHWGAAKVHIARADLLDRILYLYRRDTDPPEFTIEIV